VFDELLAHDGVEEASVLRSRVGFLGFHGGSLERMTDVIAEEAAERADASCYVVRQPPHLRWHVPSTAFDPRHSERLASFLAHVHVAIAIHGYGRPDRFTTVLLGGRNRVLADHVADTLDPALPEYRIVSDLDEIPAELAGQHPDNPVNRPPGAGVQVELPPRVRGLGPYWDGRPFSGLSPHTEALVDALATAARTWPGARS
jgi:phage replication-related protein YjqB (UPF0714/DUF867 family)